LKTNRITSIELVEDEGITVDIEVDGDNLFFANDILTHNSQLNRSTLTLTIDELSEGSLSDSWKKMMIADGLIAMHNTPEERSLGRINFKTLKSRNGEKDLILPLKIYFVLMKHSLNLYPFISITQF